MKIYDSGKVIAGLIVFLAIFTSPIWINALGRDVPVPKPELPKVEKQCVREASWMRANHMQLLNEWRNEVVRSTRHFDPATGQEVNPREDSYKIGFPKTQKSLTLGCLKCHDNTEKFCDRCHTYTGVDPFCWDCHVDLKSRGQEASKEVAQ